MKIKFILALGCLFSSLFLQAQTCDDNAHNDFTDDQFINLEDGTAVDKATALMWQMCSAGQIYQSGTCIGTANSYNWLASFDAAIASTTGGFNDWRLPNIKELVSIQKLNCVDPVVDISVFKGVESSSYWTATPSTITGRVWIADLNDSSMYASDKIYEHHVLLVRDVTQ